MPQLGGLKRTLAQKRIEAAPAPAAPPPAALGQSQAQAQTGVANGADGSPRPPVVRAPGGGGVVVIDPRVGPAPAPPGGPVAGPKQSGDRLLELLATKIPADLRPVPGGPGAPPPPQGNQEKTQQWLRANARPGTPITMEVQLVHCSGLQQNPSTKRPYAYLSFRGINTVEHAGIRHTLNISARVEDRKANDAVQLVQGQTGRLTATVTECRIGGWSGNRERGLSAMTFMVTVDNVQFTPNKE
jgi:hypothetical protein